MNSSIKLLDNELKILKNPPKAIIVSDAMFHELHTGRRLMKKRGVPDIGFDYWTLDGSIFLSVDPLLGMPYQLPPNSV